MPGNWKNAITDVIRNDESTRAAEDTDEERFEHHREVAHDLQAAIARVAEDHLGDRRDVILTNLRRELEASGHWPQPKPWLEAVAEEMESGHVYRVAQD